LVMTADSWLTSKVPALKDIADFDRRYYAKLEGPTVQIDAQQMATAMAMMPGLKEAFARNNRESLDGTAIQTTTTIDSVKSADQMKQQQSAGQSGQSGGDQSGPSVGGVLGGLMRRRSQNNAQNNAQDTANNPRTTFMTIDTEVLKIATSVSPADVALPAGFKLK
jgi:hypothetical protein